MTWPFSSWQGECSQRWLKYIFNVAVLLTNFLSHDTTSNALSFALYYLAVNPVSPLTYGPLYGKKMLANTSQLSLSFPAGYPRKGSQRSP